MSNSIKEPASRTPSSHVRFDADEYRQIDEDSVNTGKSIPQLLKERYFSGPRQVALMTKPDLASLRADLSRIGNNLNQMARRLNSGIRSGFYDEISKVQEHVDEIRLFLSSRFCRCKSLQ